MEKKENITLKKHWTNILWLTILKIKNMLAKLKRELSTKEALIKKEKKAELKIKTSMDYETISDIITEKLMEEVKKNVC